MRLSPHNGAQWQSPLSPVCQITLSGDNREKSDVRNPAARPDLNVPVAPGSDRTWPVVCTSEGGIALP